MRLEDFFGDPHHAVQASFKIVSPNAREAFKQEILPQIENMVTSKEALDGLFAEAHAVILHAFKKKNVAYNRLIQYKGIEQSDNQFEKDMLASLTEWYEESQKLFEEESDPEDSSVFLTLQDVVEG